MIHISKIQPGNQHSLIVDTDMFKKIITDSLNKINNINYKHNALTILRSKSKLRTIGLSLAPFIFISGLSNCSLDSKEHDYYANSSASDIYNEAVEHLNKGRFEPATKSYEALETHFPFGDITTKGQLEMIYAYYKDLEYLQAITAAERFIRLHPLSEHADYAHFLKGVAYFEYGTNMLEKWLPSNPALRDISKYKSAFESFNKVVTSYPNSKYANDARSRMVFIRNIIAEHELTVAKYYIKRDAYLAAANRARYIIEHLPNTPAEKNALEILKLSYDKLNLTPKLAANNTKAGKKSLEASA